jgi:hypothetical protein
MSIFSDAEARTACQFLRVGGETVLYRRKPARAPIGAPQPIVSSDPDPAVEQQYDLTVVWREDETTRGRTGIEASAWCPLASFDDLDIQPAKGDLITRAGRNYVVAEDPKDGADRVAGMVTLYLRFNN